MNVTEITLSQGGQVGLAGGGQFFEGFKLNISTADEIYGLSVLVPGEISNHPGVLRAGDFEQAGAILSLTREGDDEKRNWVLSKITEEQARELETILQGIKTGDQEVTMSGRKVEPAHMTDVTDFLEPRIVLGAEHLDKFGKVLVSEVNEALKEKLQEKPPLSRA